MDFGVQLALMDVERFYSDLSVLTRVMWNSVFWIAFASFAVGAAFAAVAHGRRRLRLSKAIAVLAVIIPVVVLLGGEAFATFSVKMRSARAAHDVACDKFEDYIRNGAVHSMTEQQASSTIEMCGQPAMISASNAPSSHVTMQRRSERDGVAVSPYWVGVPRGPWKDATEHPAIPAAPVIPGTPAPAAGSLTVPSAGPRAKSH